MPKTPDKTIYEKFVAFKHNFHESISKTENCKQKTAQFMEIVTSQTLQEVECNLRFEDDVIVVGDTIIFKSKVFFFDASGEEISAQSVFQKTKSDKDKTDINNIDLTQYSRRYAFYALLGVIKNSSKYKNNDMPELFATMMYDDIYNHAYEQAKKDLEKDAEFPFSKVSEEKRTELMIENCRNSVQTPKINCADECEMGGVPKGFKGFN